MTVFELKTMLSRYPDDWKVVIDTSTDYEEYSEVSHITPCEFSNGFCGNIVKKAKSWTTPQVNAIFLT